MKVSICIASHNMGHLLSDAIRSCLLQYYNDIEVIVLDDDSKDQTQSLFGFSTLPGAINYHPAPFGNNDKVKYFKSPEPSGTGGAFNKAIEQATGDIIVLLCADDVFTDPNVIGDIVNEFKKNPSVVHVTRFYHQFVGSDRHPVRAWRCRNIIELANNPSGLAFRRSAMNDKCRLTNKMFVESSELVFRVMVENPDGMAVILPWDTVAVRVHASTSRQKGYYSKRWTSSPVEEWSRRGGGSIQSDFVSFIQIKNFYSTAAVIQEVKNFLRLRPINALNPAFWFFALLSILTPRCILIRIPDIYRATWGRWTTREVTRDNVK